MKILSKHHRIMNLPILMYHEVSETSERNKRIRDANPAYSLSILQFTEQMQYLYENGYQTFSLNRLIDCPPCNHDKSVVITFDDGWENNYTNVFPLLKKWGLTATIFVVTDFVGKHKYLNWSQLIEMSKEGMSIQSHTASHRALVGFKNDQLMYELRESKKSIEDHLGSTVDFLSVPHGMINQRVIDMARAVGYKAICTSDPGLSHSWGSPAILRRINISDRCEISTFEKIVQGNYMVILSLMLSKKIKNLTKRLLGYNNYRKLYRLRYGIGE